MNQHLKILFNSLQTDATFTWIYSEEGHPAIHVYKANGSKQTRLKISLASDYTSNAHLSGHDHVQFYSALDIPINDTNMHKAAVIINAINNELPVIGFSVEMSNGKFLINFRNMMLTKLGQYDVDLIKRTVVIVFFLLEEYTPRIHQLMRD